MATYLDSLGENQFVVVRDINHPRQELLISAPYKKYVALLTQSGTDAPVATVLENTLGGDIFWSYDSLGSYIGTISNYSFDYTKTVYFVGYNQDNVGNPTPIISVGIGSSIYIYTTIIQNDGTGIYADNVLNTTPIEIRVYN